jgi:hypothetical protein
MSSGSTNPTGAWDSSPINSLKLNPWPSSSSAAAVSRRICSADSASGSGSATGSGRGGTGAKLRGATGGGAAGGVGGLRTALASSSAMICRMDDRISSIEGSLGAGLFIAASQYLPNYAGPERTWKRLHPAPRRIELVQSSPCNGDL